MLEEAIKENTSVLRELLARLSNIGTAAPAASDKPAAPKAQEKPAAATTTGDKVLNYDADIKPMALALAKKDRTALTKIWEEMKVKVGSELKPEQYAEALAKITAASK